jgi:hypothetical protein
MRLTICLTAALVLCACSKQAEAPPAADNTAEVTNTAPAATPAAFTINETSWEYTDPKSKKAVQESIDANGNYVTWAGAEHVDHGTAVMKDGKACFTSAMNKEGEECWSDPKLEIGASGETVSDKGEKLPIKRIAFTPVPDNVKPK